MHFGNIEWKNGHEFLIAFSELLIFQMKLWPPFLVAEFQIMNPPTFVSLIITLSFFGKNPHLHLINTPNFKKKCQKLLI